MIDDWQKHGAALLEAAGEDCADMLNRARLALAFSPYGDETVVRVKCADGRAAWCRTFSTGWACVALAPWGSGWDADHVPRATFFAGRWPKGWMTPGSVKRAAKIVQDVPMMAGGMCWANDPAGGIRTACIVQADPLTLTLQRDGAPVPAAETALTWRALSYNVEGWRIEWMAGRHTFHNFRLGAMRAGLRLKQAGLARGVPV